MSDLATPALAPEQEGWAWLPAWLRPLREERHGTGSRRLVETTLLLIVGLILAVASVNDLVRAVHVNQRLIADLRTWRHYTGHDYKNISTDQELLGTATKRDVLCGNTEPGPPKRRPQICLVIAGPTRNGMREVLGGWYLPPDIEDDVRSLRHGCFGSVTAGLCPKAPANRG
jgi:hypothetical protein